MRCISHISTAAPEGCYSKEDVRIATRRWLNDQPEQLALMERFIESCRVETRHFVLPPDKLLELGGQAQRSEIFLKHGYDLALRAATDCLAQRAVPPSALDALLFTSCSVPAIPPPDVRLIEALNISPSVLRLPLYQQGCAGGIAGLALARELSSARTTLLVSAELCSLVFHTDDLSGSGMLSAALFGDGAACALIEEGDRGLVFVDALSFVIPNSSHLMGYDIRDTGSYLVLDSALPGALGEHLPGLVRQLLSRNGVQINDVPWWLFHPGGVKILDIIERDLGLSRSQTHWAWDVLRYHGNMSSATILYVMELFMRERVARSGDYVALAGVGPGLALYVLLFRWE